MGGILGVGVWGAVLKRNFPSFLKGLRILTVIIGGWGCDFQRSRCG